MAINARALTEFVHGWPLPCSIVRFSIFVLRRAIFHQSTSPSLFAPSDTLRPPVAHREPIRVLLCSLPITFSRVPCLLLMSVVQLCPRRAESGHPRTLTEAELPRWTTGTLECRSITNGDRTENNEGDLASRKPRNDVEFRSCEHD